MTVSNELDRRFRAAAAASGDLDVHYDLLDTPVGPLLVGATDRGLCRIWFDPEPERFAEDVGRTHGLRVLRVAPFHERVLAELRRVPYGQLTTYGTLAAKVDAPRAARAVGTVMNRNPLPIVLPCHRVVGANGSLIGYGGGLPRKEQLLRLEGALI